MSFSAREITQTLSGVSDIVDKQSVALALSNKEVVPTRAPSKLADTISSEQIIIGVVVAKIESGHGLSLSSGLKQAYLTIIRSCSQDVVIGQSQGRNDTANARGVCSV